MTEKQAKEWLCSLKIYEDEENRILDQIIQLRAVAESCTVRTDKESIQTSGSGDTMANIVGKIVDLERKLTKIDRKILNRRDVFEKICGEMENDRHRQFLTIRYFDGNSFYETVMLMDLTDSTGRRIQKRAVVDFMTRYNEKYNI